MVCRMIGDSHVGKKHRENQDRIVLRELGPSESPSSACLIAVVDGASCSAFAASLARWIADLHLAVDPVFDAAQADTAQSLAAYLNGLHGQFVEEFEDIDEMLQSAASISLAVIHAATADVLWTGDSPVFWTTGGVGNRKTTRLSTPHNEGRGLTKCFCGMHPCEFDQVRIPLSDGDIVTVMSDGAIHEETLLSGLFERFGFRQEACREILDEGLSHPHADDVSIAACQWGCDSI